MNVTTFSAKNSEPSRTNTAAAAAPLESLLIAQEKIAEANQTKQDNLVTLLQRQIEQLKIKNENLENDKKLLTTIVADKANTIDALQQTLSFNATQADKDAATIKELQDKIVELSHQAKILEGIEEIVTAFKPAVKEDPSLNKLLTPSSRDFYKAQARKLQLGEMIELHFKLHKVKQ